MKIFDLEQDIMNCWNVVDDIRDATHYFADSEDFKDMPPEYDDAICNLMMGLEHVYRMRFEKMWKTFEEVCKEYHSLRRAKEDHDYMEIK